MQNDTTLSTELFNEVFKKINELQRDYALYLEALKKKYSKEVYVAILNKLLEETNNLVIAKDVITEILSLENKANLSALIDFILTKNEDSFTKGKDICDLTNVKVHCIKAIEKYKDKSAVTPLLYCLNNKQENYKIRLAIAETLGKIEDKHAVDSLINVVKDEEEKSVYVRESAAFALGMIGDMRAINPFLEILETKRGFLSKFSFLKERILEALGRINFEPNERIISALEDALMDTSTQIRLNALESISNSNCIEMFDTVKELLSDDNEEVARGAVITLYNLKGREILDEIINNDKMPYYCIEQAREIIEDYENDE